MLKFVLLIAVLPFTVVYAGAQKMPKECSGMKYEHRNMIDPLPLLVKTVAGIIIDDSDKSLVSNICVAVFEEGSKKLVKVVYLDVKNNFRLSNLPEGSYRVVVKDVVGFFCPANIPVKIDRKISHKKRIVVHMQPSAIDVCSFGELAE